MYWPYSKNKSIIRRWTSSSQQKPRWFLPFYQYFCRFQALHSIFHHLVKVPSQRYMSEFTVIYGLSPCNSWWGWGTGVLKWHLPSSHLWSHWSHWRSENIGTIRLKRTDVWQHGGIEGFVCILDGYLGPLSIVRFKVHENFQNGLWPVGAIGQQPEVRQRLLRRSRLPFHFRELVACARHIRQLISMKITPPKEPTQHFLVVHSLNSMSSFPYPLRW